jgi:hypothetical protein
VKKRSKNNSRKKSPAKQETKNKNSALSKAMEGNQNARNGHIWSDAIRRAAARAAKGPKGEGNYAMLNKLADTLVKKAGKGNVPALKEFGDRVEGKVPQAIEGTGPGGTIPVSIKVTFE